MCVRQKDLFLCQEEVPPGLRLRLEISITDLPKGNYCSEVKIQYCGEMVSKEMSAEEMNNTSPTSSALVQSPCTSASKHNTLFCGSEYDNNDRAEDPVDCSVAPSRAGSNTPRNMRQQDMNEAY